MYERFLQYLRKKNISQSKLSELSGVSSATVSRFCGGAAIGSDKLLRLIQCCDDLSLEWFFYGTGTMIRSAGSVTYNNGAFAGSTSRDSVMVSDSAGAQVRAGSPSELLSLLAEKDRVISERDRTITELHRLLVSK